MRDLSQPLDNHIGRDLQIACLRPQKLLRLDDFGECFGGIGPRAGFDLERFLLLQHMSGFQELLECGFVQRRLFPFADDG